MKEISKDYIKEENTEMLAKEELQQFLELYAKENERVAEEYIGDGQPLFSNEVKDLPKWNPQNEKMQEEIIQFFAAVTMDLRRTNEIQRQKINQQEKRIRQLERWQRICDVPGQSKASVSDSLEKSISIKRNWADDRGIQYTKR